MGDPFDTWTHGCNDDGDKDGRRPRLWLRDFLPVIIPTARILTFGYDADLRTRTVLNIMGFAENLLAGLRANRETGVRF